MVQEVKVQSSNFAAEYGTGGMNVSGVTKAGSVEVPRRGLRLLARLPVRRQRPLEQHRRHAEAEEQVSVSRRQHRRSDHLRRQLHEEPGQAVLLRRVRSAAAAGRLGLALHAHLHRRRCERRLQRAARQPRLEPEQRRRSCGFRRASRTPGSRRRTTTCGRTSRRSASTSRASIRCPNYSDPEQSLQLRLQRARADRTGPTSRARFDWNISNSTKAYVRVAREGETRREPARRVVGPVGRGAAVVRTSARTRGKSVRRQRRLGAEPVDDERGAGQLQPADARQPLQGSERASCRAPAASRSTASSRPGRRARICRPTCCTDGAAAARSATCGPRRTTSTPTTTRCSSATS